jgi:hypothetical protein
MLEACITRRLCNLLLAAFVGIQFLTCGMRSSDASAILVLKIAGLTVAGMATGPLLIAAGRKRHGIEQDSSKYNWSRKSAENGHFTREP